MRQQREQQMLKAKRAGTMVELRRDELALRARPLTHAMAMLSPHFDGRQMPVLGAQVPLDVHDALSEEEAEEALEAHAATNARVASDAPIEMTVPAAELAHLSFDLPVMAVLVERCVQSGRCIIAWGVVCARGWV